MCPDTVFVVDAPRCLQFAVRSVRAVRSARAPVESVDAVRELAHGDGGVVDDDAFHRIDRALPRCEREHSSRLGVTGLPARLDAGGCEVDILEMILAVEAWRDESRHVPD